MKPIYLTLIIVIIGILTLFFFPEPQTNFLAYFATAIFFILTATLSVVLNKKN